uniref:(California timema) hypothetical protein n=1 Tax=Timema californicum TaxID=61474 RepID=A0A7R9JF48_TIMCA|nr:unnamed protein product [Timema californicum]
MPKQRTSFNPDWFKQKDCNGHFLEEKEQSDDDFEIGVETRKTLKKLNLKVQKSMLHGMRKFYHTLSGHLLKKLPLHNVILKESRRLSYENRCEAWTVRSIKLLANAVSLVPPCNVDFIGDEWRVLQCEQIPDDWNRTQDGQGGVSKRVDDYWSKIFNMKDALDHPKYPELTRVALFDKSLQSFRVALFGGSLQPHPRVAPFGKSLPQGKSRRQFTPLALEEHRTLEFLRPMELKVVQLGFWMKQEQRLTKLT